MLNKSGFIATLTLEANDRLINFPDIRQLRRNTTYNGHSSINVRPFYDNLATCKI